MLIYYLQDEDTLTSRPGVIRIDSGMSGQMLRRLNHRIDEELNERDTIDLSPPSSKSSPSPIHQLLVGEIPLSQEPLPVVSRRGPLLGPIHPPPNSRSSLASLEDSPSGTTDLVASTIPGDDSVSRGRVTGTFFGSVECCLGPS